MILVMTGVSSGDHCLSKCVGTGSNSLDFDGALCISCMTSSLEKLLKLFMNLSPVNGTLLDFKDKAKRDFSLLPLET